MNLSQQKRERLLNFIKQLKSNNSFDEKSLIELNEIENELNGKKYGLVWEEHEEAIDAQMKEAVPVFAEDKSKEIVCDKDAPYNFLLEGDNLHSLHLLEKTHKGKIDVIYIDPPYNTGNRDFVYNDVIVGQDDGYRHSKWLSFMYKRLLIAKELMNEKGVIFISIDDNEMAQLKLLCDSLFNQNNFICSICRQAIKGGSRSTNIRSVHDYVLVYAKNLNKMIQFTGIEKEELQLELVDEKGAYKKGRELNKWGAGSRREDSPTMWFPIKAPNGDDVYPIRNDGSEGRWRWGKKKLTKAVEENDVIFEKRENGTYIVYEKVRSRKNTTKQYTTWFADEYINSKGSESIKKIFNTMMSVFNFAKPVELVHDLCFMGNNKNATILDFFAGSGTTAQAVMELNEEDGGNRNFILCTNNENDICEKITYQRLKTVITGKRADGSKYSDGLPANLKYFKTDFVSKSSKNLSKELTKHVKELIELEWGISIDKKVNLMVLSEEELDKIETNWDKLKNTVKSIYRARQVVYTGRQKQLFKNINNFIIPDYYFNNELKEVGENW